MEKHGEAYTTEGHGEAYAMEKHGEAHTMEMIHQVEQNIITTDN